MTDEKQEPDDSVIPPYTRNKEGNCIMCGTDHKACSMCGFDAPGCLGTKMIVHYDWAARLTDALGYQAFLFPGPILNLINAAQAGDLRAMDVYKKTFVAIDYTCLDCEHEFEKVFQGKGLSREDAFKQVPELVKAAMARADELGTTPDRHGLHVVPTPDDPEEVIN